MCWFEEPFNESLTTLYPLSRPPPSGGNFLASFHCPLTTEASVVDDMVDLSPDLFCFKRRSSPVFSWKDNLVCFFPPAPYWVRPPRVYFFCRLQRVRSPHGRVLLFLPFLPPLLFYRITKINGVFSKPGIRIVQGKAGPLPGISCA